MEQIVKAYGKFLLEAVTVAVLLGMLFAGMTDEQGNVGIFRMMGAYLSKEEQKTWDDYTIIAEESERSLPWIFYRKSELFCRESYSLSELFGASDCEGKELPVKVRAIYNPLGILDNHFYDKEMGQIIFDEPGIYTLQVSATDEWNHVSVYQVHIPVN